MTDTIKHRIEKIRRGEVPEGYKKIHGDIVPLTWDQISLSDCIIPYEEKTSVANQYPVLTSSRKGLMLQTDYYSNRQVTTEDNVGYNIIPYGYITFRSRSDDGRFKFNQNTIIDRGIISYFYPVFTFSDEVSCEFLLQLLNHTIYKKMFPYAEGTAQQVLSLKKLGRFKYSVPQIHEQQKIATVLSSQDKLVELKEKRLAEKQRQKKYLMQQLLTGKKRLSNFHQPWERKKLADVLTERREKNIRQNLRICSVAVQKGVVDQIEHLGRSYAAADTSNYAVAHYGDLIYTKSPRGDFPYGIIKQSFLPEEVAVSPLYGIFVPNSSELGFFLHTYFESSVNAYNYLLPIIQKGAKNTINIKNETFLSNSLYLPTDPLEQKAIANIFLTINQEIDLLRQDIEQEKQKKKALMQLLLTGIVRVTPCH